ncbi:MAG: YibE/F family protein, partial [Actinomycetota bacterium]|nr:YibE/F family protein [Actinomycetota bacterium]
ARFSGFTSEESTLLIMFETIDVGGLLLAGMVLGAAGALDDVTVTQSSAVWQFRAADPEMSRALLYRRGLRIGRAHIGSTVNTLLLAYLGAALPLTILFILAQQSLGTVANSEVVAVEITRTLVGSIGLVAAVPVTTWLAARVASEPGPGAVHSH